MALLCLLDRPIAFHRCLVEPCGGITAALLLGQALYWSKRPNDPKGWFWKIQREWEQETGLSRKNRRRRAGSCGNAGSWRKTAWDPGAVVVSDNMEKLREALAKCYPDKDGESRKLAVPCLIVMAVRRGIPAYR